MLTKALLFLAALALAGAAAAQTRPADKAQTKKDERAAAAGGTSVRASAAEVFRGLDHNRDGTLSEAELWSRIGEQSDWAAIDRNRDGRISRDEFTVVR